MWQNLESLTEKRTLFNCCLKRPRNSCKPRHLWCFLQLASESVQILFQFKPVHLNHLRKTTFFYNLLKAITVRAIPGSANILVLFNFFYVPEISSAPEIEYATLCAFKIKLPNFEWIPLFLSSLKYHFWFTYTRINEVLVFIMKWIVCKVSWILDYFLSNFYIQVLSTIIKFSKLHFANEIFVIWKNQIPNTIRQYLLVIV